MRIAATQRAGLTSKPSSAHFTHEGGTGGLGKENQDTFFEAQPCVDVAIYGVLDGHGKKYGRLAAHTAAGSLKRFLCAHHKWLLAEPEECMRSAFREAHIAIQEAILDSDSELRLHQSGDAPPYIIQWMATDEDELGQPIYKWDAIDGGTTATVLVVLRETALLASVGDSSAVLFTRNVKGVRQSEQLLPEHSPTNLGEYIRVQAAMPGKVKFVYDCAHSEEINIFDEDENGNARLDVGAQVRVVAGCQLHLALAREGKS